MTSMSTFSDHIQHTVLRSSVFSPSLNFATDNH